MLTKAMIEDALLCDEDAWKKYGNSQYGWIFNKMEVARSQGIECAPLGIMPKEFPVFIKPIINLSGLNMKARKAELYTDFDYTPGCFWMEFFDAPLISVDFYLENGLPVWYYAMCPDRNMDPNKWEKAKVPTKLYNYCNKWIRKYLKGFDGWVNLECIANKIVEVHLRASGEFFPLYKKEHKSGFCSVIKDDRIPMHFKLREMKAAFDSNEIYILVPEISEHLERRANGIRLYRVCLVLGHDIKKVREVSGIIKKHFYFR